MLECDRRIDHVRRGILYSGLGYSRLTSPRYHGYHTILDLRTLPSSFESWRTFRIHLPSPSSLSAAYPLIAANAAPERSIRSERRRVGRRARVSLRLKSRVRSFRIYASVSPLQVAGERRESGKPSRVSSSYHQPCRA